MASGCFRITVLGVGNILLQDEGVGVRVVEYLSDLPLPDNVALLDGGTATLRLGSDISETDRLIVVDAVRGGSPPGSVYRIHLKKDGVRTGNLDHIRYEEKNPRLSLHQLELLDTLSMLELTGKGPDEIVVIGVEPKEIRWNTEISRELEEKIPEIAEIVLGEING